MTTAPKCWHCGEPLPPPARTGRPRRFCSKRCKDDFHLERHAQRLVDSVVFEPAQQAAPVTEAQLRQITIEALASALDDRPLAPPQERLVVAVVEARVLAHGFHRLSREVSKDLAWRAESMSNTMNEALGRLFDEGETDDPPR